MATAVIVMVFTMALYNILAVIVLQSSMHSAGGIDWRRTVLSIVSNPLLLAGLLGLVVPLLQITLPSFLQRALEALGAAAVPIALMCIGGSLANDHVARRRSWIVTAALLKVAVLPCACFPLHAFGGTRDRPTSALPSFCLPVRRPRRHSLWPARWAAMKRSPRLDFDRLSTVLSFISSERGALWVTSRNETMRRYFNRGSSQAVCRPKGCSDKPTPRG